ncbi:SDR family oxidoreductase [Jiangella aurantiaca]|uniref:SDR family oxidoreductase n=1 Tax=Jiangella aurantiaca TaxID=2530373 RepID=A0A4R5A127_9ACTN|nr:SDR family NAD(P)-dependent oxidoreductase [Jiangella aurantiaca]TDD65411.1 SDR family oxidoreductase [Jiangella aurantiaca]
MTRPLDGQRALVTGAGQGIGRGIALALAEAGAHVVVNDLRPGDAHRTAADVAAAGVTGIAAVADVSTEDGARHVLDTASTALGGLDVLVNNAGIARPEPFHEITLQSWHEVLDNNLTSAFLCARGAIDLMRPAGYGRIVQVSSVVAHQGALYGHAHYAASKSALLGLTRTLARTAAPYGITVNAVAPGVIATELSASTLGSDTVEELRRQIPLGIGTVDDVAAAALFLAGPQARYVTGTTLDVNGGLYMR